jgi:protein-arginine kinase activator protein McsA
MLDFESAALLRDEIKILKEKIAKKDKTKDKTKMTKRKAR